MDELGRVINNGDREMFAKQFSDFDTVNQSNVSFTSIQPQSLFVKKYT